MVSGRGGILTPKPVVNATRPHSVERKTEKRESYEALILDFRGIATMKIDGHTHTSQS